MKKLLVLLMSFIPFIVNAATLDDIFKETEFAYYRNSYNAQYNSSKSEYYDPAEATSQDVKYSVCSRYTRNVYKNAFNINIPSNTNALMKFVNANYNDSKYKKYIVAYHDCVTNESGKNSCNVLTDAEYNSFISKLKPGDVMVYTKGSTDSGHALIVYDTFTNSDGKKDAYVLNSTGGGETYSRNTSTNRLFNTYRKNSDSIITANNADKGINQGTIKMVRFREDKRFKFNTNKYGEEKGNKYRVAIIRFIVDDKYPVFDSDYKITEEKSIDVTKTNGYLRSKYKDLTITKTVSAGDNDVAVLNEELTYTLKIKNNSNKAYGKFYIQETINKDTYATITNTSDGTINGNTINIEVPSLAANSTKTITYKVKVTDNINYLNNTITSTGKFSDTSDFTLSLTTGTVKNKIDNKLTDSEKESIKSAYNSLKGSKSGLDLINETYKTALNIDLDLTNFDITDLIVQDTEVVNACNGKGKLCKNAYKLGSVKIGNTNYQYKDMILNNYWNGLINSDASPNDNTVDFDGTKPQKAKELNTWGSSGDSFKRAKTVKGADFENGDILIYYNTNDFIASDKTKSRNSYEDGLYAYIYIDGKFVGVNKSGNKKRNYFTPQYYQDHTDLDWYSLQDANDIPSGFLDRVNYQTLYGKYYYVILRPALEEGMVAGVTAEYIVEEEPPEELEEPTDEEGDLPEEVEDEDLEPEDEQQGQGDEEPLKDPPYTGNFISKIIIITATLIGTIAIIIAVRNQKFRRI